MVLKTVTITLNFGELSGSGPYSGGGSDTESTGGGGGGGGGGGNGGSGTPGGPGSNPAVSSSVSAASAVASAADQVKSMLELQHNQLPGSYGLYARPPYGNNQPGTPDPGSFGSNRGHLGGYPFAPMPGQNPYTGYNHLGYPTSQSPVRDGKKISFYILKVTLLMLQGKY